MSDITEIPQEKRFKHRIEVARKKLLEAFEKVLNHGIQFNQENVDALELQALRLVILELVQSGRISYEEIQALEMEKKAEELNRQLQEICVKPKQNIDNKNNILVLKEK